MKCAHGIRDHNGSSSCRIRMPPRCEIMRRTSVGRRVCLTFSFAANRYQSARSSMEARPPIRCFILEKAHFWITPRDSGYRCILRTWSSPPRAWRMRCSLVWVAASSESRSFHGVVELHCPHRPSPKRREQLGCSSSFFSH